MIFYFYFFALLYNNQIIKVRNLTVNNYVIPP